MTRRPRWTVTCPVCGEELPERGNKRVYVPWKRGFRLVHADDCAGLIEAQGVLDVTPPKVKPLSPVQIVRARATLQGLRDRIEVAGNDPEDLLARCRLGVALLKEKLVVEEPEKELYRLRQAVLYLRQLHGSEYSGRGGRTPA